MFIATDYNANAGQLAILDTDDGVTEWYYTSQVKEFIKKYKLEIMGAIVDERCNPKFSFNGLKVNLAYKFSHRTTMIDRFMFVILLPERDRWGMTFLYPIEKPTVAVFDLGAENFPKMQYPCGQYITSYYIETLLQHQDWYGLVFDAEVPVWQIDSRGMRELKEFLKYQMEQMGYLECIDPTIFTLEGYTFEYKIHIVDKVLYCEGHCCFEDDFIKSLKDDYNECIRERKLDREASFREYLETLIKGDWIRHNIELCESRRKPCGTRW